MVLAISIFDGKTGRLKSALETSSFTLGIGYTEPFTSTFQFVKKEGWMERISLGDLVYISRINLKGSYFDDKGYLGFVSMVRESDKDLSISAKDCNTIFDGTIAQTWSPVNLKWDLIMMMDAIKVAKCSPPWWKITAYDSSAESAGNRATSLEASNQDIQPWDLVNLAYKYGIIIIATASIWENSIEVNFTIKQKTYDRNLNIDQKFITNLGFSLGGSDATNIVAFIPSSDNALHTERSYYILNNSGEVEGPFQELDVDMLARMRLPLKATNKYYSDEDYDLDEFKEEADDTLLGNNVYHEITVSFPEKMISSSLFRDRPIVTIHHDGSTIDSSPRQVSYSNNFANVSMKFGFNDNTVTGAIKKALSTGSSTLNSRIENLNRRIDSIQSGGIGFTVGDGLIKNGSSLMLDFGNYVQPKIKSGSSDPTEKAKYEGEFYINITTGKVFRSGTDLSWSIIGDISNGLSVLFKETNSETMTIEFTEE